MVHYSSDFDYYEGGAKNPLKGTSMKLVINARNAQFCVLVGRKNIGKYIMAYIFQLLYSLRLKIIIFLSVTYAECQDTMYRVACLE